MENHLSNDRIISYHRNKLDYVESPVNSLQFAYGDRRYEKMTRQLVQETDILKFKILTEINEDFRRADFINLALLSSDILDVLINHCQDPSQELRELASRSIVQVCSLNYGRERIINGAYITNICNLIDDNVPQIRTNSYNAMLNLAEYRIGAEHILLAAKLPLFVDKLIEEKEEHILIKVLQLIKKLLEGEGGTDIILGTEAIQRLTNHLENKNAKVLEYEYFEKIMNLLNDPSLQTKLNIIQLISSISEHPVGRKMAHGCLNKLQQLKEDKENEFLVHYIDQTVEVITWVP